MQSVLLRRRASSSSGRAAAESIAEARVLRVVDYGRVGGERQRARQRRRRQDLLLVWSGLKIDGCACLGWICLGWVGLGWSVVVDDFSSSLSWD